MRKFIAEKELKRAIYPGGTEEFQELLDYEGKQKLGLVSFWRKNQYLGRRGGAHSVRQKSKQGRGGSEGTVHQH